MLGVSPRQKMRREVLMVTGGVDRLRGERPQPRVWDRSRLRCQKFLGDLQLGLGFLVWILSLNDRAKKTGSSYQQGKITQQV